MCLDFESTYKLYLNTGYRYRKFDPEHRTLGLRVYLIVIYRVTCHLNHRQGKRDSKRRRTHTTAKLPSSACAIVHPTGF